MSLRKIIIHPDPRLKKVCDPVADLDDDLRALADNMLETMYQAPGIGLAATHRVMVSRMSEELGELANEIKVDTAERWQGLDRPTCPGRER